jgi:hypothetical protein
MKISLDNADAGKMVQTLIRSIAAIENRATFNDEDYSDVQNLKALKFALVSADTITIGNVKGNSNA